jgi:hypothetical protein
VPPVGVAVKAINAKERLRFQLVSLRRKRRGSAWFSPTAPIRSLVAAVCPVRRPCMASASVFWLDFPFESTDLQPSMGDVRPAGAGPGWWRSLLNDGGVRYARVKYRKTMVRRER